MQYGSIQDYTYDTLGRISTVFDNWFGQCTTRRYGYDADSNRTSLQSVPPLTGGACDTTGLGTTTTSTYDTADRLTNTGVAYDALGRTTTLPAASAGGQALTGAYYADDRVQSLTQNATTYSYALDPLRRVLARGTTGSKTLHYADDTDNPAWTGENVGESQYTRQIPGIDGNLAAIYDSATGQATIQLPSLHGDIDATAGSSPTITGVTTLSDFDEFGAAKPGFTTARYGWLGAKQRSTEFTSGTTLMGQRVYQPQLGRFLQTDPVPGGSANDYDYTNQDPIDHEDLDGTCPVCVEVLVDALEAAGRYAARAVGRRLAGTAFGRAIGRVINRVVNTRVGNALFGRGRGLNRGRVRIGVSVHHGIPRISLRHRQ